MKLITSRQTLLTPQQIEPVRQRLERWRRNRKKQRSPIPGDLWASAAELAGKYGLAKIARALRLDYYSLKERLEARGQPSFPEAKASPAFLELVPPATAAVSECTVEMEGPRGARMRIHLTSTAMPDLTDLSDSFWRMGR